MGITITTKPSHQDAASQAVLRRAVFTYAATALRSAAHELELFARTPEGTNATAHSSSVRAARELDDAIAMIGWTEASAPLDDGVRMRAARRAMSLEPRFEGISSTARCALILEGIATVEQIEAMSDEELLAIEEVGPITVRRLRGGSRVP